MINIPRWQVIFVLIVCGLGIVYAAPNLMPPTAQQWLQTHMPGIMPRETVNLGLDLRGGSHLLLEVETDAVVRDHMSALVDDVRKALRKEKIGYTGLGLHEGRVALRLTDPAQIDAAHDAIRALDRKLLVQIEGNAITVAMSDDLIKERQSGAMEQSLEIVRRRIDETGTREPSIQRQGDNRILVQLPGVDSPQRIKDLLGQTAKMAFRFVDEESSARPGARPPPGTERLPTMEPKLPSLDIQKRVIVSGENLVDARATRDQRNRPAVSFKFDSTGGRRFGEATRTNVERLFAIVLDNKVISAPRINEPIPGGNGIITGDFTPEQARDLAVLLRAGALPAPIKVLEERTVGPGLGADSVKAGKFAAIAGAVLVMIFMVLSYGLLGFFSALALLINIAMIFAVLSILQATLTLPGIAGIVLTIGTAVDANVLIFERIREEQDLGRSPIAAIDTGYGRALSAIIDANVTNLISAMLLVIFGSGTIKGFGVTLTIGIITSVFSAYWVTRLMVVGWLRKARPKTIPL